MKKVFCFVSILMVSLFLFSCEKTTQCYVCVSVHSVVVDPYHTAVSSVDTVRKCMTLSEADKYQTDNTVHSQNPGDNVEATSCYVPALY